MQWYQVFGAELMKVGREKEIASEAHGTAIAEVRWSPSKY